MSEQDPSLWIWAQAREALERVDRLHRRFFELGCRSRQPVWEPPVDVFEVGDGLFIQIALPGVDPRAIELRLEADGLVIAAERPLPQPDRPSLIHRLEIPYGHFERRLSLPTGHYDLERRELVDGCLVLWLRRTQPKNI